MFVDAPVLVAFIIREPEPQPSRIAKIERRFTRYGSEYITIQVVRPKRLRSLFEARPAKGSEKRLEEL